MTILFSVHIARGGSVRACGGDGFRYLEIQTGDNGERVPVYLPGDTTCEAAQAIADAFNAAVAQPEQVAA